MLKCPVCRVPYTTSGEQQPRLLVGCGHTFCSKCLQSRNVDNEVLTCPQCSLVSNDPHVPNITIMGYVEATTTPAPVMHPIPPPRKVLCQDCKERQATLICFQCLAAGFKFCNDCSEREHNRDFGPVKGHNPQPIEKAAVSMPVPSCSRHPDKPCLFFSFKVSWELLSTLSHIIFMIETIDISFYPGQQVCVWRVQGRMWFCRRCVHFCRCGCLPNTRWSAEFNRSH